MGVFLRELNSCWCSRRKTHCGPPSILQSDHRYEFVANVSAIKLIRNIWTDSIIIPDRPSHPHPQGGFGMANGDLETKLGNGLRITKRDGIQVPLVVYDMNTSLANDSI